MKLLNPQVSDDLRSGKPIRLHLGAGTIRKDGYYSLDLVELPGLDIVGDLNQPLDAIPTNSVAAIYTGHTLEHVGNLMGLMAELHRICGPDAEITVVVPHFSNPYYYSDPTHVRPFGLYTMHYFMDGADQPGRGVPPYYTTTRFLLKSVRIRFYRTSLLDRIVVPILHFLVNFNFRAQEIYERRWIWFWPASEIRFVLQPKKSL